MDKPSNESSKRRMEHAARVLAYVEDQIGDGDCGYYFWWPEGVGVWSAADLRIIADHLDEINAKWDEIVRLQNEV